MPGGKVHGTENGCFAKTFSLDPEFEPNIFKAVTSPGSYLENVYQDEAGRVNFFETSYTQNGRAVFSLSDLGEYKDAQDLPSVDNLLILNWNENIIPAVARLNQAQAAAYFMLGETTGTSAGGTAEEGKFLRVPGTNPFFPLRQGMQGNRFLELLETHPMEVYLMNTGRVGGKADDDRSKKVKIPASSAIVKAIAEQTIKWDEDGDFGYEVAGDVPGVDDIELLQPRRLYERQGRMDEYDAFVERFKRERAETLAKYSDLTEDIIRAVS
jgi:phosphoenolpyruvate carboxykinase (ATP)